MSAIITENFRRNNAQLFLNNIATGTDKYYLGIGKQDQWDINETSSEFNVPIAIGTRADALEILGNLNTLVALNGLYGASGRVIPTVPYKSNSVYKAYSSYDDSCFYPDANVILGAQPCYVTVQGAIYMCLKQGINPTTGQPNNSIESPASVTPSAGKYSVITPADGYVWVLVQEAEQSFIIRNNTFTDVRLTPLTNNELNDSTTQCGGLISGFTVTNGGSGYTADSVFRLRTNDGFATGTDRSNDNILLNFTFDGVNGVITSVSLSGLPASWPKGAIFASVDKISGPGTDAVIVPTIAPPQGFAHIPANVMPSWFAGISVKLEDNIASDNFFAPYRQISIVKNVKTISGEENSNTLNALKYFSFNDNVQLAPINSNSSVQIIDNAGNTIGFADYVSNVDGAKRIYFHQNNISGYRELPNTGFVKIGTGVSAPTYAYTSINTGEFVNDGNAEVLFTENRSFITRAQGQLEDLILIIQF